jgi:ATP-dependent helicase/DNAse subunit B
MIADVLEINQTEKIELSSFKYQEDTLEIIEDTNGLSIEEQDIVGGTSVFAAQAECPFKAFIKFRLQAKALKTGSIGLLPEVRGEILHQVLAKFWRKFQNLANLLVTPEFKLDLDLAQIINSVILYWQKTLPNTLTPRFITVEKKRIQEICKRWLEVEKTRANFVVSQIETSVVTHIGQAKIKIRLDRIDIDDQGNLIIIDYKTGAVAASVLYGERLLAPQLPLYALTYKNSVKCVSFASLKANNLTFTGLAAEGGILDNIKISPNWDKQLAEWQTSLEQIASEFMAGDARIMPINGSATCRNCNYSGVCRVGDSSSLCGYT